MSILITVTDLSTPPPTGGANPAIRTLFYRLVRLLSLTITPVFVFDGPHKPAFKRHRRSRGPGDSVSAAMAKRLIRLFGFAAHDAPGEAEAECALLQRRGVVDAVLSEDVDTIMFGCTRTLRNWSAEAAGAAAGARPPTHVSLYDVADLRRGEAAGLDREGLVLVALMSGGDYLPEGVPGCGVKVACEAARAGFGTRLCRIKRSDPAALRAWREDLVRELRTNGSGFFRVRHRALTIADEFPDMDVLRYYTHPVVSQADAVERLRSELPLKREIDIAGLRAFTVETFDWTYKVGAIKFIRVLAPSLLVRALMDLSRQHSDLDDPDTREEVESRVVRSIKSRRTHFSTDGTPELRMVHIPNDIVGVDLDAEEDEVTSTFGRSGLALNSDDEVEDQIEERSGPKKVFDPLQPDLAWVPETVAKLGVPLMVEDWEGQQRAKQAAKDKKAPTRRPQKKASDMPIGALDRYVKVSKSKLGIPVDGSEFPAFLSTSQSGLLMPPLSQQVRQKSTSLAPKDSDSGSPEPAAKKQPRLSKSSKATTKAPASQPPLNVNPWSIASSQTTPRVTRTRSTDDARRPETILISSSPAAAPSPPPATAPAAVDANTWLASRRPPALSPINDNPRVVSPRSDSFDSDSSTLSSSGGAGISFSLRKHSRSCGDAAGKPAAKRPQKSRPAAAAAAAARPGSPAGRSSARPGVPAQRGAQSSIKSFGRLTEAMGKKDTTLVAKPPRRRPSPVFGLDEDNHDDDDDDDSELEDVRTLGSKTIPSRKAPVDHHHHHLSSSSRARKPDPRLVDDEGREDEFGVTAHPEKSAVVVVPSPSPPAAALLGSKKRTTTKATTMATTRLYIPRTSDAGLGYFREVEVTREEADRMMREEAGRVSSLPPKSKRRGGGGGRQMWRESEVTILDLTGED